LPTLANLFIYCNVELIITTILSAFNFVIKKIYLDSDGQQLQKYQQNELSPFTEHKKGSRKRHITKRTLVLILITLFRNGEYQIINIQSKLYIKATQRNLKMWPLWAVAVYIHVLLVPDDIIHPIVFSNQWYDTDIIYIIQPNLP
jgi:hypothetical protein